MPHLQSVHCRGVGGYGNVQLPSRNSYLALHRRVRMRTSIRVSEETKRKLEAVKQDDETFDELLDRLVTRTPEDVAAMAGFADEGIEDHMEETHEELSESLGGS